VSSIQPFYNQPLPHSYVSRIACNPREISSLRILPVATGVCPHRKQKREQRVCVSSLNPRFSVTCSRLQSLCALFRALALYFQRLTASFPKTPGWGGPVLQTFRVNAQPLFRIVGSRSFARTLRRSNEMRGNLKVGGDTGTVTSRTFVAAAGLVLGFALQDAARAAQVLACSRPLVRDPHRVQPGEVNSLLRRPRTRKKRVSRARKDTLRSVASV